MDKKLEKKGNGMLENVLTKMEEVFLQDIHKVGSRYIQTKRPVLRRNSRTKGPPCKQVLISLKRTGIIQFEKIEITNSL